MRFACPCEMERTGLWDVGDGGKEIKVVTVRHHGTS